MRRPVVALASAANRCHGSPAGRPERKAEEQQPPDSTNGSQAVEERPSEQLEMAALKSLHEVADAADQARLGLQLIDSDASLISLAPGLPESAIVINRAIIKAAAATDLSAALLDIAERYRANQVPRYFVQLVTANDQDQDMTRRYPSLKPARAWQKFKRDAAPVDPAQSGLFVTRIGPERGADFARIVCAAFDLGEQAEPWLAKLPGHGDWQVFMSFAGDQPAGVGAMYVRSRRAWCDFGATAPEHRRKGSQTAVLVARVEAAIQQGCTQMFTCTGVDVPGDPQHSYKNILKVGFVESYVRHNYAPVQAGD